MISVQRFLAVLAITIPGIISVYGWTLMKDSIFADFSTEEPFDFLSFSFGFLLFIIGVAFIGGYYVYRDRKKKELKFSKNKNLKSPKK